MIELEYKDITRDDIKTLIRLTDTVNTRHMGGYEGHDGRITSEHAFIHWIEEVVPKIEKAQGKKLNIKMLETWPEYMKKAIHHLDKNYDSIEDYMKSLGLRDIEVEKLKEKVLK